MMSDHCNNLYWRMIDAATRLRESGRPWAAKPMILRWLAWAYRVLGYKAPALS